MLFKKLDEISGKVLKTVKPLLFSAAQAYVRPPEYGSEWWLTTTTIWNCDELIGRRIRDWRRLTQETGHSGSRTQSMRADHDNVFTGTHSVFPIPLAEWILLRYGGPPGGLILDAFAGGPPRAIVSAFMGFRYLGYDIRQEQIDENIKILYNLGVRGSVDYRCSDGTILDGCDDNSCNTAFSCPPYYDLEQYSDLPNDLSNMPDYETFIEAITKCAKAHRRVMKPGSFVCMVTGPFRDKTGDLLDFPGDTIRAFKQAGFILQQTIILSKNFASAAVRSTRAWAGHKLVPRHEVLIVLRTPENGTTSKLSKLRPNGKDIS